MPDAPRPGSLNQREISEAVYEVLREKILSCQLAPEQGLTVDSLAKALGVGRIAVREALGRLWASDLIEIPVQHRTVVAQIRPERVRESFEVREALEGKACELLQSRLNSDRLAVLRDLNERLTAPGISLAENSALEGRFHQSIVEYAGNEVLLDLYMQLSAHLQIGRIHYRSENWRSRLLLTRREHNAVIEALAGNRMDDARELLTSHIRCSTERMIGDLTCGREVLRIQ